MLDSCTQVQFSRRGDRLSLTGRFALKESLPGTSYRAIFKMSLRDSAFEEADHPGRSYLTVTRIGNELYLPASDFLLLSPTSCFRHRSLFPLLASSF